MIRTAFAGLTKLSPGESPWQDGGTVFERNLDTLDHFARQVVEHRHDEHAPLTNPAAPPAVTAQDVGGTLPADTTVHVGFTAIDADGGETLVSPAASIDTPLPGDVPAAFAGAADYVAGDLPDGTYYYVLTATDGAGGETPPSDPVSVVLEEGHANGQVILSGFTAAIAGAAGWRLYRSVNGGDFGFVAAGATDGYTDDESAGADVQLPPPDDLSNGTAATAQVTATVAAASLPANTVSYRLYASADPTFPSPSLVGEWPVADAGTPHVITTLALDAEQPPPVSTSKGGAHKITLAELAGDVSAAIAAGGGGGGGGGAVDAILAGTPVRWVDADGNPVAELVGDQSSSEQSFTNNFTAAEYNPATSLFDVGQGTGATFLVPKAATSEVDWHGLIGFGQVIHGDGFVEGSFTINDADAGWDTLGVGWGEVWLPAKTGLFVLLDRAADQVQIAYRAGEGDPYTVLASAALPTIADGDVVYLRLTRTWNATDNTYDLSVLLNVAGVDAPSLTVQDDSFSGWSLLATLVAGWTDPASFAVDGVTYDLMVTGSSLRAMIYQPHGLTHNVFLLDEQGQTGGGLDYDTPVKQKAGVVAADGTAPGDLVQVTKTGPGAYDVTYYSGMSLDGTIIVITDPGGATITNVSPVGFSVDFGADTDFRFIAVEQN